MQENIQREAAGKHFALLTVGNIKEDIMKRNRTLAHIRAKSIKGCSFTTG